MIRGSVDDGRFQAFWIAAEGTVSAAMHVNDWDAIGPIRELVERRAPVDAARLGNLDQAAVACDRQAA